LKLILIMQKKFFAVATFALAFAVAFTASAYDLGSTTLKVGSRGAAVVEMQKALNACTASTLKTDGKFGPNTTMTVKAFQVSKGLVGDGLVGNNTKAALNSCGSMATTPSAGDLCPNGMTFASNCMAAPSGASTLALCPNGMTLASNCSVAPATSVGTNGVAGDISNITLLGSPSNIQVSEGEMKQVAGFEVLAAPGSNLGITSVRVDLTQSVTGSSLVTRYLNTLALFAGSTQVATVDTNSIVRNGNTYSVTFNVASGTTVPANQRAQMYIGVKANSTIDSADIGATWTATVNSVRFVDGTGAILTFSPTGVSRAFSFLKLSNNSSIKLRLSEDANSPKDRTVTVNNNQITNDVEMLRFNIKAEGAELKLRKMSFQATSSTSVTNVSSLFKLRYNGNVVDSVSPTASAATITALEFTKLNGGVGEIVIPAGSTASFAILADINSLNAYPAGSTLKVELLTADYSNNSKFTVEDITGGSLGTSSTNRPGSVTGYTATFRTEGVTATINSTPTPTTTINNSGAVTAVEYKIRLNIAASGNDFFMPRSGVFVAGANNSTIPATLTTAGIAFAIVNNSGNYVTSAGTISPSINLISGGTLDPSGRIKISSDNSAVVELTVSLSGTPPAGQYKVTTLSVNAANTNNGALSAFATTPVVTFETPFNTPAFQ
jgi:hypothetical protein